MLFCEHISPSGDPSPSIPQKHGDQSAGGDGREVGKELHRSEDHPGGRVSPVLGRLGRLGLGISCGSEFVDCHSTEVINKYVGICQFVYINLYSRWNIPICILSIVPNVEQ